MTEEKTQQNKTSANGAAVAVAKSVYGDRSRAKKTGPRGPRRDDARDEYAQKIIDIARVTRVMAGGKRMRFRACVAVGDKKGKIAVGLAKGADVTMAITKAANKAKKNFVEVPIVNETIPHEMLHKKGAALILFKPAPKGRGIIAGGAVRIVMELSGVKNITCKTLGTNNKLNNAKCVIEALSLLKKPVKREKVITEKVQEIKETK